MLVSELFNNPMFPQFVPEMGWNVGEEAWNTADMHILFVFAGRPAVRVVSQTHVALYNILKEAFGDRVFVDISFMPESYQQGTYYKNYPALVGSFSKRTWEDFDIMGISIAITMEEFAQSYKLLYMSHIPLHSRDRINDEKYPFILLGGIGTDNSTALDNVVDLVTYGLGERQLPALVNMAFDAQAKYGSVRKAKTWLQSEAPKRIRGCYNPANYHYRWDNKDGHIESYYDGADEGYEKIIRPDVALPIDSIYVRDTNRKWSLPGNQRKGSITSSLGCSGGGTCSFCHESSLYGAWRERPFEEMIKGVRKSKLTSMCETFSYESFNHNFVSDFPASLQLAYEFYDRISVINFRLDAIAASIRDHGENNYLTLLKNLGTISVSGAVEGFSQRIRDNIVNKNLKFEDWLMVEREAFKKKFIRVKNGFILTGFETKDDWKDATEELKQILDARDEVNSNSIYMMSVTKLVHNAGCALYWKPRVCAYINWKESFDPDFYYYPFMPFVDMGVKVHLCSAKGDTFVQQLLQDLPADLCEDILMKPALQFPVMSADYLKEVKRRMEKYEIDPKEQFLHFNVFKNPHQHQRISYNDRIIEREGVDQYFSHPHPQCLKTPALLSKGEKPGCKACGACEDVQATYEEMKLPVNLQGFDSVKKWTLNRPLKTDYNLSDIKTAQMKNAPSFWYTFMMDFNESARLISKENLIRQWLKKIAEYDENQIENFRRLGFYVAKYLDYDGLCSNYYGYDMVTIGFRDKLPENFNEAITYANEHCTAVKCLEWETNQTGGFPDIRLLVEMSFNLSLEDLHKVVDSYEKENFRIYSESLQFPEEVSFPFDYKILQTKEGYKLYLIIPPKANPAYTLMSKYNYNQLQQIVKSMRIRSILAPLGGDNYYDMIHKKNQSLSGFVHVDKSESEFNDHLNDSAAPEAEGA